MCPSMVYVLPLPVWPYANRHTLYPSSTDVSRSVTAAKMWLWVDDAGNTCSYSNDERLPQHSTAQHSTAQRQGRHTSTKHSTAEEST